MKKECCCKEQYRDLPKNEDLNKKVKDRLSRIIGQLNGISKMLDDNRYCGDVLIQMAAAKKALESVSYEILENHMNSCVKKDIESGKSEIISETIELIKRMK